MVEADGLGVKVPDNDRERLFDVVINIEEQYSIWPESRALPAGWRRVGFTGTEADCLSHIEKVWVDMRPLSIRTEYADDVDGLIRKTCVDDGPER